MQNDEPILSISGMRGVVGRQLRADNVVRYVAAASRLLPKGAILVGRDSRRSSQMLWHAVVGALQACGRAVIDLGIVPTPTVGVAIRCLQAAGAVQITGSHNPADQNGIKLLDDQGKMLSPAHAAEVIRGYRLGELGYVESLVGQPSLTSQPMAQLFHLTKVLQIVDTELVRRQRYRVLVDANGGAGGLLAKRLLEELGCKVIGVGLAPDGSFRHPPEPLAENLAELCEQIPKADVHIAFCQDPDGDRVAIVDGSGRFVGEECTLALCLRHVLGKRPGPVVINCATSMMNEHIASAFGVPCVRAPVGEAHVVAAMQQHQAVFGGEGNGGPIDPRVGWIRDSFVGMALILEAMASHNATVAELVQQLPQFVMRKLKVPIPAASLPTVFDRLIHIFGDAGVDHSDGLRLHWHDRWLLCRPSNTEAILRIIAEGSCEEAVNELCRQALEALARIH